MAEDGLANDWHKVHYGSRAVGGVGLIIVEATGVEPVGRISDNDLGIWNDQQAEALKPIVDFVHQQDTAIALQLAHAGRKSEVSENQPIAPSPIAFNEDYRTPKEMTKEDINRVIHAFKSGAKRAHEAGFDAIEIHGAHGYLINEFLSPLTNKRTDNYGGSLEKRMNFLMDIIKAVKTVWPEEKSLHLRVSADEYDPDGNALDDIVAIVKKAKNLGIDLVNVSSGGVLSKDVDSYFGYQIKLAEAIKAQVDLKVLAGGLIVNEKQGEEIIRNNRADLVYFGRKLLRDPYFPLNASLKLEEDLKWPESYEKAKHLRD
jgi:NADPH2 dehydrogenase